MFYAYWICMILFLFICAILILLVLIQKGRGGGLSSAFGGSGGNTAFGAKTGDVLTWATSVVFAVFITLAVVLNLVAERLDKSVQAARLVSPTQLPSQAPSNPGQ